ncbi:MAG: NAD(P)-dependent oxidoreductase [Collinsella sp.]
MGGHFATLCRSMGAHVRGIKRHPLVYPIVFEDMDGIDALPSAWPRLTSSHPLCPAHRDPRSGERRVLRRDEAGRLLANGGRGDLVVADDLVAALESGHLAGAAVDVTDPSRCLRQARCGMRPTCSSRRTSRAGST